MDFLNLQSWKRKKSVRVESEKFFENQRLGQNLQNHMVEDSLIALHLRFISKHFYQQVSEKKKTPSTSSAVDYLTDALAQRRRWFW